MSKLVDERGRPISSARAAHEGADYGRELATWHPGRYSADGELLDEADTLTRRTADLVRNNGFASGAVQMHVDNVIGSGLLLNAKPDRRALGLKGDDMAEVMDDLEDEIESKFDAWAEDPGCYVDASRRSRLSGLLAQAYRTYMIQFEILATAEWLRRTGTPYRTAVQMVDPARLSNPPGRSNDDTMRAGVEMAVLGEPVAYHIASHIMGDMMGVRGPVTWQRVERETRWGRQKVLHVFDNDQPGRSRGKGSITSVLMRHRMHDKFARVSLEAAAFNAMYAAYIKSSFDWTSVAQAMGAKLDGDENVLMQYLKGKTEFHRDGHIKFDGVRVPHLFPGEELKHLAPAHPTPAFNAFEEAALRYLAAGWNLTYEQLSRDYSKTNYSSARASLLEAWKFFNGKQYLIGGWFATMVYTLWLEEAVDRGAIVLPPALPDFWEAKAAWTTSDWIGPGRGHIDPLKEANGAKVWYSMNLETLESLAAEKGRRWRDLLDQRRQEQRYADRIGLDISGVGGPTPVQQPAEQGEQRGGGPQDQPAQQEVA